MRGLGLGALLATASLTGGTAGLRALAAGTVVSYLLSAALAYSVRVRASPPPAAAHDSTSRDTGSAPRVRRTAVPPMRLLLAANVIYVFCLSIPEVALPLVLVTQLHASPVWAAVVFVINTGLVVAFQVPVTVWMSRFSRRTALATSGVVISVSYLGFLGSVELPHRWAVPAIVGVSVLSTLGELIYAGSSTALVAATAPEHVLGRALARFQLSTGFSLAISPAIITALVARGPAALWVSLTAATLLAAAAVARPSAEGACADQAVARHRLMPGSGLCRPGCRMPAILISGELPTRPAVLKLLIIRQMPGLLHAWFAVSSAVGGVLPIRIEVWTAPVILEALIPGRMQSHACTAEVPRGAA